MRTLRAIVALHLLAWSQTLQVIGGAVLPGARPKNRAAKVVRLAERKLKPGEKLEGVELCVACGGRGCRWCHVQVERQDA